MNSSKTFYYGNVFLILVVSTGFLFYYADRVPISTDDAGYWFNFTNRTFIHRWLPNHLVPNHTLPIYLAKGSLFLFGNNDIGLKLPMILFTLMAVIFQYILVNRIWKSPFIASLSASLLMLLP